MNKYQIFHATSLSIDPETEVQPREDVGFVNANSLEEAFKLSQNINGTWNKENPCRSTSVGDIICDTTNFKYFLICGIGFKELIEPEQDLATLADQEEESKYLQ